MHPLIQHHRASISRLCQRYKIRRLEVFGSAARSTDFDPASSDADFLIEFSPEAPRTLKNYFAVKAELESLLEREVDLVEPSAVRNPYLLAGINSTRELVYAA